MTISSPEKITLVKGAPEIVLAGCHAAMGPDGKPVSYDREGMLSRFREAAARGERVIAVSAKVPGGTPSFVALLILKDRIRSDARAAVRRIREAGIRVVMVTGDAPETASAIAADVGILRAGTDAVVTAGELSCMSDGEVAALLPRLAVVARALPQDKTRLVRVAQSEGLVVGMTGDGINDAPSLRLSDVGFAMGSGCDVARGAGDVVITDNSLSSIGNTVLFGRTVFHSIRKFITFQLMMNLAACGTSLFGQFIGIDNPITIIQMLWINIIMDTLGGLAFAGEAALSSYMKESPKRRDEPILTRDVLHRVIFTGGYTLALSVAFLVFGRNAPLFGGSIPRYLTAFYALFVFSGLFNCFNARTERVRLLAGVGKNKPFLVILTAVALIQTAMIYLGGELFRCVPLSAKEFFTTLALAATVIPFDFIRRVLRKLRK